MSDTPTPLLARIQNYLSNGGFWNPEMMDPKKVGQLMIDIRDHLTAVDGCGLSANDLYHVMQAWETMPASEEQTRIVIALGKLRAAFIARGDSRFVQPLAVTSAPAEAPACVDHGVMVADNDHGESWHCAVCSATFPTSDRPSAPPASARTRCPHNAEDCDYPHCVDTNSACLVAELELESKASVEYQNKAGCATTESSASIRPSTPPASAPAEKVQDDVDTRGQTMEIPEGRRTASQNEVK